MFVWISFSSHSLPVQKSRVRIDSLFYSPWIKKQSLLLKTLLAFLPTNVQLKANHNHSYKDSGGEYLVCAVLCRRTGSQDSNCVPSQKLFSFYALDSICKNAGSPYTIYFSKDLFNLYKKTYLLVDNATRRKLVSLFKTWLTPSETTGTPLFDASVLGKIQNFLVKASALHQRNVQTLLPAPTVLQLLNDIDSLTKLTEQRLNLAPNDEKLTIKLQVLSQLKQELQKEKLSVCTEAGSAPIEEHIRSGATKYPTAVEVSSGNPYVTKFRGCCCISKLKASSRERRSTTGTFRGDIKELGFK